MLKLFVMELQLFLDFELFLMLTQGVDNLNNIEITLDNPAAGTYKIIVTGTSVPLNTQEFAVVYDYVAPELVLTLSNGGKV
jgi:hypothetical protein